MHKWILGLIVGSGLLLIQVANASEMVRYEPSLYLAKSESTDTVKKKTMSTAEKNTVDKATTKHKKAMTKNVTNKKHDMHKHPHAKKHTHKQHHKKKHHVKHKREMTKSGMERYIDKVAPDRN